MANPSNFMAGDAGFPSLHSGQAHLRPLGAVEGFLTNSPRRLWYQTTFSIEMDK